jgi:hypothetical protein
MSRKWIGILVVSIAGFGMLSWHARVMSAQEAVTATPARAFIPTQAPPEQLQVGATPTWTRTPTLPGPALLEAKADAGEVNVRAEPDINSERIGTIRAGDTYVVLGKRFRWYQFQFDTSPNGRGWVFEELIDIIGDAGAIPNLDEERLPTIDPAISAATETQIAITLTPGGLLTATAEARVLPLPELPGLPGQQTETSGMGLATGPTLDIMNEAGSIVLPTFTYPPEIIAFAPTEPAPQSEEVTQTSPNDFAIPLPEDVPPIAPILVLGALGMLGLVISSLRR